MKRVLLGLIFICADLPTVKAGSISSVFITYPFPEPVTLLMLGVGLASLARLVRKRNNKNAIETSDFKQRE